MKKILIIDDDPDITEAMKVVLESRKYQVVTAISGEEGLKAIKAKNPDLIILDVMMETGDKGFDVARALKGDKTTSKIPILMLTAIKDKMGLDFKNEAGDEKWLPVDAYLDKPMKPEALLAKVEELLN